MTLRLLAGSGQAIFSVEEWRKLVPPKRGDIHWVDGRSAKQLANAFFEDGVARVPPVGQRGDS